MTANAGTQEVPGTNLKPGEPAPPPPTDAQRAQQDQQKYAQSQQNQSPATLIGSLEQMSQQGTVS